jgi:inositol 1,4,5-triphosphate receptor type 1
LQNCIATHESNGIDIIIALILNDINPLGKKRMDLVLELKVRPPSQRVLVTSSALYGE